MNAAPLPRQPFQSNDRVKDTPSGHMQPTGSIAPSQENPVFALKELVARWYREQNKIQDLLSSLGFALRNFNNINQFLELIPLVASRATDAEGSAIVLFKSDHASVKLLRLHCQEGQRCQDIRKAMDAATRQIASGTAVVSGVAAMLTGLDYQVSRYLGSEVQLFSTPILVRNSERGRLYVFSRDSEYVWTNNRQKLIQLVADQAAVAIENDELAVELRHKERLDREMEIGAEIQRRLLPRTCPQIKGVDLAARCQTANRVGGDYYDFIPASQDKNGPDGQWGDPAGSWSIAIGDVMGKGVPAGLIMTMTRGMLRAEVLNGHSPARILQHLNRVMYVDLDSSNRFVTLFYSEYDPETRVLSYSNAAQNPPLLWQASTDTIQRLDTVGMLIGLDTENQYLEDRVTLMPGDAIAYYTDGFTDAGNAAGDRFDEDNLTKAFRWACHHCQSSQEILEYLFEQVQQFIGSSNRNSDDMTLIVMRITE